MTKDILISSLNIVQNLYIEVDNMNKEEIIKILEAWRKTSDEVIEANEAARAFAVDLEKLNTTVPLYGIGEYIKWKQSAAAVKYYRDMVGTEFKKSWEDVKNEAWRIQGYSMGYINDILVVVYETYLDSDGDRCMIPEPFAEFVY